jgi:hypothetical protein
MRYDAPDYEVLPTLNAWHMDVLLSRRAVLTAGLKFGSATALAALVGCTVEAATRSEAPTPPAPPVATPTPTSTLGRRLAPTSTLRPIETRLDFMPSSLAIPALGIDAPVAPAEVAAGESGLPEIAVPASGIVSPNHLLGDHSVNNVWILGHSRWHKVPQLLYTLANLDAGDVIELGGVDQATGRELQPLTFDAERLVLADTETTAELVYSATPTTPRLVIQTSARQTWDPDWILDRDTVLRKADVDLAGGMDDLSTYLLLLVTATLSADSLAMMFGRG